MIIVHGGPSEADVVDVSEFHSEITSGHHLMFPCTHRDRSSTAFSSVLLRHHQHHKSPSGGGCPSPTARGTCVTNWRTRQTVIVTSTRKAVAFFLRIFRKTERPPLHRYATVDQYHPFSFSPSQLVCCDHLSAQSKMCNHAAKIRRDCQHIFGGTVSGYLTAYLHVLSTRARVHVATTKASTQTNYI